MTTQVARSNETPSVRDKVVINWDDFSRDGNAWSLIGVFGSHAREQGWPRDAITAVREEALSGDYNNVLTTLSSHIVFEYSDDDDEYDVECDWCDDEGCDDCEEY